MNEKSLLVLEQYDLHIESTYRYKGNYGCMAKEGRFILQEYENSNEKMVIMNSLYRYMEKNGLITDSVICNKEGQYVSISPDGYNTYILKKWFDARECDRESVDDVLLGARALGKWHKICDSGYDLTNEIYSFHIDPKEQNGGEVDVTYEFHSGKDLQKSFYKHNKEIVNIRNFIKRKKNKNNFEIFLQNIINEYHQQGIEALRKLDECRYINIYNQAVEEKKLNYGNFNYHNFLIKDNEVIYINMSKVNYAPQIQDLYDYLRKIMEKTNWDKSLGIDILEEYSKENRIEDEDKIILKTLLSYPEKFWKIINYYYNSNKAWYSEKNEEKLIQFREQEEKRWRFIEVI